MILTHTRISHRLDYLPLAQFVHFKKAFRKVEVYYANCLGAKLFFNQKASFITIVSNKSLCSSQQ